MLLVVPHLGTSVGMWKSGYRINSSFHKILCFPFNGSGDVVHASDSGDDPELVPDSGPAVGSPVSLEEALLCRCDIRCLTVIGVGEQIAQSGADVVDVDPAARMDILLRDADGIAILDDLGIFRNICQGKLMSLWDIFRKCETDPVQFDGRAGGQRRESYGHIVCWMDSEICFHDKFPSLF